LLSSRSSDSAPLCGWRDTLSIAAQPRKARSFGVFGIKTGTLVRDARRLCPAVIKVEANHRRYTDYHERILKAVDTCLPATSVPEFARLFAGERWIRTIGTCKISYRFETDT
jgi:nucleotidyltransferase/DNA polymerase involved in DNA repair